MLSVDEKYQETMATKKIFFAALRAADSKY